MNKEKEVLIDKLSKYIEVVEELKSNYPTHPIINNPIDKVFLYRGHADKEYNLIPGLFRKTKETFEKQVIENDKYLAFSGKNGEKDLLKAFIHYAKKDWNIEPTDFFHWAELAQHYGVPTRFLDWSQNPLVALFFASSGEDDKDGSVLILHKSNYDCICSEQFEESSKESRGDIVTKVMNSELDLKYPVLYTPYYVDDRMNAQDSYFLVWGTDIVSLEDMFNDAKYWMQLPNQDGSRTFGREQREGILFRITVPGYAKQPLLRELDSVGISARTLFPDMSGLGKYIEWKFRFN